MKAPHLLILGAGRSGAGQPLGVQRVTLERRVLDWQLDAFSHLAPEVDFVGGYEVEQVMRRFPRLTYHFNPEWSETGAAASLAVALEARPEAADGDSDLYVSYSDILLRPELVRALEETGADACAVALDDGEPSAESPARVTERFTAGGLEGEFIGLIRVPAQLAGPFRDAVLSNRQGLRKGHLSALMEQVTRVSPPIRAVGVSAAGLWGHAEHGRSVARFILGTKAATLDRLRGRLQHSRILPLRYFTRARWDREADGMVRELMEKFGADGPLIVRSSATDEDGFARANAGRYHSELDVAPQPATLRAAIDRVFASYSHADPRDEVLVQPQISGARASGVVFTRMLASGAPYRVVDYTEGSDTTAVTRGASSEGVKLVVARSAPAEALHRLPETGRAALEAVQEIEGLVCYDALDVEFAVAPEGGILTLQVRPLMVGDAQLDRTLDERVDDTLAAIHATLRDLDPPSPGVVGGRAIWSVMADWNPAEIIGLTPGPLALDLYRRIITDRTWAVQRREVGYRDVTGVPLVRSFGGQAFVDVRASVNSFVPAALSDEVAARIVDNGLERLRGDASLHDKIEFEIVPSSMDFGFDLWRDRYRTERALDDAGIEALRTELAAVTRRIIERTPGDVEAAKTLEAECEALERVTPPVGDWLSRVLDRCREPGALRFSHLARAGFVAVSFLRSAVAKGLLAPERRDALLASITTVGGLMAAAAWEVRNGALDRDAFVRRFGHLRPGTYDITTPAYRDRPDEYVDPIIEAARPPQKHPFTWTAAERTALNNALCPLSLGLDADGLLNFIDTAVAGREYSKFVFTRLLSAALDGLAAVAREHDIPHEQLDALPWDAILDDGICVWGRSLAGESVQALTARRAELHRLAGLITLPPVILEPDDLYASRVPYSEPTFITHRHVRAPVRVIRPGVVVQRAEVEDRIVAITHADPGYDYVFALGISGLITAYGGPNSHMAIRASEFSIPAVIGIGGRNFDGLVDGAVTQIDGHRRRWQQEVARHARRDHAAG